MDLARYDEIDGREAANRLIDGLDVYSRIGNKYYVEDKRVWMESGSNAGVVSLTVSDTLRSTWFVKKPFDVRAEMLERPNEWVAAYQDKNQWMMVGMFTGDMRAREWEYDRRYKNTEFKYQFGYPGYKSLNDCIPIEDVQKEELS